MGGSCLPRFTCARKVSRNRVLPFLAAAARTFGMPRVQARAVSQDDSGEEAGAVPSGCVQRGGSTESSQVIIRAPQSSG